MPSEFVAHDPEGIHLDEDSLETVWLEERDGVSYRGTAGGQHGAPAQNQADLYCQEWIYKFLFNIVFSY